MKIIAFLKLIRAIACGVVVLGASNALGQVNDGDALNSSGDQMLYPSGMQIPLTETEIPGSSYFIGPDGERIDASTLMNQVPTGQEIEIPSEDLLDGLTPSHAFSPQGVYDGTLSFPMGTFPTTPFGERILSAVPSGEPTVGESQSAEIKGLLLDENGRTVDAAAGDGKTSGMKNGVPVDPIVRPDNSPTSENKKNLADAAMTAGDEALGEPMGVLKPNKSGGIKGLKNEVKIFIDSDTGQVTLIGDKEATALVAKSMEELAKQEPQATDENQDKKLASRQNRLKQRLQEAIDEKERLSGLLRKANQKTEALTKKVAKLKEAGKKQNEASRAMIARLAKDLKKTKVDSQKLVDDRRKAIAKKDKLIEQLKLANGGAEAMAAKKISELLEKLKQADVRYEATVKAMQDAEKQAKKNAANAEAKIAAAEANAGATNANDKAKAKANAKAVAAIAAQASQGRGGKEGREGEEGKAGKARKAKAIAELEVSRKLKEMEERKKVADAAADAAEDAGDGESNKGETAGEEAAKESALSLDDQIKRLKVKRDHQIAESETRIRARQQREIDKLLEQGKAVDSDDVRAAVDKMKAAIKISEEKLRSRFLRRLERLKDNMKKSLK